MVGIATRTVGRLAAAACGRLGISPPVPLADLLAMIRPHRAALRRERYRLREFAADCQRAMPEVPVFSMPGPIREANTGVDWAHRGELAVAALAPRLTALGFNNPELFIRDNGGPDRVERVLNDVEANSAWQSPKAGVIHELKRGANGGR